MEQISKLEKRRLLLMGCGRLVTGEKCCGDTSIDNSSYLCPRCNSKLKSLEASSNKTKKI